MSNIYEALQRARKESASPDPIPLAKRERPAGPFQELQPIAGGWRLQRHAEEVATLFSAVRPFLDGKRGAVLHVVSATHGEGTSTIAREFAFVAATAGNHRALLIDGDLQNPQTAAFFECPRNFGAIDCLLRSQNERAALRPVEDSQLSVARLCGETALGIVELESLRSLYAVLRERFDLTVIDCPPIASSRYAELVPEATDGVIFVIQAEKVRPAVVAHARDRVEQAGGRIIGAVLNRRRNHVPKFIYKRL